MSFSVNLGYGGLYGPRCVTSFVKLTDSSLKTLEEYNIKSSKDSLKIKFDGTEGEILASMKHTNGRSSLKSYTFNFIAESRDGLTESFGCSNNLGTFKQLGAFSYKLIIKASDDVFQNTLEKMNMVEQESKKNCIKEIKFKDHERKLANFKSKNLSTPVEPKRVMVVPKLKKPEPGVKPSLQISSNDSFDFTARRNTRVAPMKRPPQQVSQNSSPAVSLPDVCSQNALPEPLNEPVISEVHSAPKKQRIAHKAKEVVDNFKNVETDAAETNDYESMYPPICSNEEDDAYRSEYEKDYSTYVELHHKSDRRLSKFRHFITNLKQETFKTDPYINVLSNIYSEYSDLVMNNQHMEERLKCVDLHKKLQILKLRIAEFQRQNSLY